jgi:NADH-quinone oxidoreductase subunit A
VNHPTAPAGVAAPQAEATLRADAASLARLSIYDIGTFFGVLLVGFAYVWRRGDLDWVRAVSRDRAADVPQPGVPAVLEQRPTVAV